MFSYLLQLSIAIKRNFRLNTGSTMTGRAVGGNKAGFSSIISCLLQLPIAIKSNLILNKGSIMHKRAVCGEMTGFSSIFTQI